MPSELKAALLTSPITLEGKGANEVDSTALGLWLRMSYIRKEWDLFGRRVRRTNLAPEMDIRYIQDPNKSLLAIISYCHCISGSAFIELIGKFFLFYIKSLMESDKI